MQSIICKKVTKAAHQIVKRQSMFHVGATTEKQRIISEFTIEIKDNNIKNVIKL